MIKKIDMIILSCLLIGWCTINQHNNTEDIVIDYKQDYTEENTQEIDAAWQLIITDGSDWIIAIPESIPEKNIEKIYFNEGKLDNPLVWYSDTWVYNHMWGILLEESSSFEVIASFGVHAVDWSWWYHQGSLYFISLNNYRINVDDTTLVLNDGYCEWYDTHTLSCESIDHNRCNEEWILKTRCIAQDKDYIYYWKVDDSYTIGKFVKN